VIQIRRRERELDCVVGGGARDDAFVEGVAAAERFDGPRLLGGLPALRANVTAPSA
jgi:hypothetical protein